MTDNTEEDVVFEPATTNIDEEIVVTPAQEAEEDIKATVDRLADIEGIERRYNKGEPLSEDERLLLRMKTLDLEPPTPEEQEAKPRAKIKSDGSTASYYELPPNAKELQDLISFKNMNAQLGEIFRACYRYGQVEHSEMLRDAKKIKYYIEAEIERLTKYGE